MRKPLPLRGRYSPGRIVGHSPVARHQIEPVVARLGIPKNRFETSARFTILTCSAVAFGGVCPSVVPVVAGLGSGGSRHIAGHRFLDSNFAEH